MSHRHVHVVDGIWQLQPWMQCCCRLVSVALLVGRRPSIHVEHIVGHPLLYLRWRWRGRHGSVQHCRVSHCAQVLRRGHVVAFGVAVSTRTVLVIGKRIVMHALSSRYAMTHDVNVARARADSSTVADSCSLNLVLVC